jgi:predicted transcriptional regulator
MTLQIKSMDAVSGIPIMQVRDFFRYIVSWHHDSFNLTDLWEQLSLDKKSAMALVSELVTQGYVEAPKNGAYKFTDKGGELVRASAASKVSRKTAEHALGGLLQRVAHYNLDPDKIFTIETVVVFGSFLGTQDKLGDLDVAVKWRDRNLADPDRAATVFAYAERSGRRFSSFLDKLGWAQTELNQILKAKKRTIRIQDWDQFVRMAAKSPDGIPCKVVFGSTEKAVAAEIRSRKEAGRQR